MATRWNGSNFSPMLAPWEFFDDQPLRKDFWAKFAMLFSASATAARSDSSAASEALNNSACVTESCSAASFAPSNFSVKSSTASSPRTKTSCKIALVRCSISESNKLESALTSRILAEKFLSVWRTIFIGNKVRQSARQSQNDALQCGRTRRKETQIA